MTQFSTPSPSKILFSLPFILPIFPPHPPFPLLSSFLPLSPYHHAPHTFLLIPPHTFLSSPIHLPPSQLFFPFSLLHATLTFHPTFPLLSLSTSNLSPLNLTPFTFLTHSSTKPPLNQSPPFSSTCLTSIPNPFPLLSLNNLIPHLST